MRSRAVLTAGLSRLFGAPSASVGGLSGVLGLPPKTVSQVPGKAAAGVVFSPVTFLRLAREHPQDQIVQRVITAFTALSVDPALNAIYYFAS